MAISLTELLGTDSISASRIVIGDNFNIIEDEINSMENFFNPSSGIINNLADLTTNNFSVGLSSVRLEVTPSAFNIIANVSHTGNLNLSGSLLRNDINLLSITDISPSTNIGSTSSAPDKTIYRVSNANTGALTVSLFNGEVGQEIVFMCEATTGPVWIQADVSSELVLTSGASYIELNDVGQTVHLLCITDGVGAIEWIIIGGNQYTLI